MSVYKPKGSPFYHFDFQLQRRRFHGSTGRKNRREADAVERAERDKARELLKAASAGSRDLTLDTAFDRYWLEVGQHHAQSATTFRDLERLLGYLGKDRRLADITDDDVTRLVAWRRGHRVKGRLKDKQGNEVPLVSAATVNRSTTQLLQAVFTRAKRSWHMRFDHEPDWRHHRLAEPQERIRELHSDEAERLEPEIRDDYAPFFDFARASGQRLSECLLRWSEVNWPAGPIVKSGKGGRRIVFPITPAVRAILAPLRGHHPEAVFTYVAKRTSKRYGTIKGRRYPITRSGLVSVWKRTRKAAGLVNFRFHDFRHDLGTKLLRQTGNLKIVQRVLNHANITTTTRYAHVQTDDVAAALERVQKSRTKSRSEGRKAG